MKAKIFSFVKVSDDSIVASTRIARFVSETLGLPICWDTSVADEKLDVLVIIGGAYAFAGSEVLETLGTAIRTSDRVIWIQNDYTVVPPKDVSGAESPFRKAFRDRAEAKTAPVDYWTTVESMSMSGFRDNWRIGEGSFWINWNALTFDEEFTNLDTIRARRAQIADPALIYYGSYRKDRVRYFDRYFSTPGTNTVISSPSKKFAEKYPKCQHEGKIDLSELNLRMSQMSTYLSMFGLGLYVEDEKSHKSFHSPANRFYEMLSAGLPMVFQPECVRMLSRGGYDVDDFIAWNAAEIKIWMEKREDVAVNQRILWWQKAKDEKTSLAPMLVQKWEQYL